MLADILPASTIHMTLHDLVSLEMCISQSEEAYRRETADSIKKAACIAEDIRKEHTGKKITMVSDRIVNMVSKSLVLMLKPQTEQDYELLQEMKEIGGRSFCFRPIVSRMSKGTETKGPSPFFTMTWMMNMPCGPQSVWYWTKIISR